MANGALSINHIGHASWKQAKNFWDPETCAQALPLITKERERQLVALGKFPMAHSIVAAHTPNRSPESLERRVGIAEGTSFCRATRGVVFGVEKQHQDLVLQLIKTTQHAVLIFEGDLRCPVSDRERHGGNQELAAP